METLGQLLKREREFRGVSLDDLSRKTRLNPHFLDSMEQDRWEELPKGAFVRGFLKIYATELGIPATDLLRRFETQRPKDPKEEDPFQKFKGFEVKSRFFFFLVFAVVVIVVAAYLSSR